MAFTEHKITAFQKRLTDLPDQPKLSAAELKAYFDSSPEELRQAHNALCTDAERLDNRVSGIVAETFGDSIPKTMLTDELQKEIDAKAEESAVAARLAGKAEQSDLETAAALAAAKCDVHIGTYTGNAADDSIQKIDLPFTPKMVFVMPPNGIIQTNNSNEAVRGGMCVTGHPMVYTQWVLRVADGGFEVRNYKLQDIFLNHKDNTYYFFALA